jgi:DNA-binding MarR family transcriptional regulator
LDTSDHELRILQNIYTGEERVRQRDLARVVGLSLGMTNGIVKRLVQKGWLTIRKVNNRNIRYFVSPEGIDQITRRSYRYFKQTIKNIVAYRETIEGFARSVKERGYVGIVLAGESNLDFIVEHSCAAAGLAFFKDARKSGRSAAARGGSAASGKRMFVLYSESFLPGSGDRRRDGSTAFLQEIVGGMDLSGADMAGG